MWVDDGYCVGVYVVSFYWVVYGFGVLLYELFEFCIGYVFFWVGIEFFGDYFV